LIRYRRTQLGDSALLPSGKLVPLNSEPVYVLQKDQPTVDELYITATTFACNITVLYNRDLV